jgi:membrane protease subunit HflK
MPGIHVSLPWPIDRITRLKVQQLQRLVVGGDLPDAITGRAQSLRSQFLTGDQNIISMRVVVQYSVGVPADYLFRNENVAKSVGAAVETILAGRVALRNVDAVLTTEKLSIQGEVRASAQTILDEYRSGVLLSSVNMEAAVPPPEASEAFRDVASARADASRIISEAQGYANDVIPKARGQAAQMGEEAKAYTERRINEALGDASRFTQVAGEYEKASEINGHRLYVETMEQILPKIRKLIVDENGNLDLTIIRRSDAK